YLSPLVLSSRLFMLLLLFNHPASAEIYTLSLHDALPISSSTPSTDGKEVDGDTWFRIVGNDIVGQWNWFEGLGWLTKTVGHQVIDRKSTRLNSSHVKISYAVFCLKKKTKTESMTER